MSGDRQDGGKRLEKQVSESTLLPFFLDSGEKKWRRGSGGMKAKDKMFFGGKEKKNTRWEMKCQGRR